MAGHRRVRGGARVGRAYARTLTIGTPTAYHWPVNMVAMLTLLGSSLLGGSPAARGAGFGAAAGVALAGFITVQFVYPNNDVLFYEAELNHSVETMQQAATAWIRLHTIRLMVQVATVTAAAASVWARMARA